MSGGSPEQALLSAAAGQMAHFYNLTGGTASGMTDSKVADGQAGAENGQLTIMCGADDDAFYGLAQPVMSAYAKATSLNEFQLVVLVTMPLIGSRPK